MAAPKKVADEAPVETPEPAEPVEPPAAPDPEEPTDTADPEEPTDTADPEEPTDAADSEEPTDADDVTVIVAVAISGTRNGEPWPGVGERITLPADEAANYLKFEYVVPVPGDE